MQYSTEKVEKACERKKEIVNQMQYFLQAKNESEMKNAEAKRTLLQQSHSDSDFKKMMQKYANIDGYLEKRAINVEE